MKAIVLHGGAGKFPDESDLVSHSAGIGIALDNGYKSLTETGNALEAVIAAVKSMEEQPTFNCGRGSVLNVNGEVEMDAAIMCSDLRAGAIANVRDILHPIEAARLVMEKTDHVLLGGDGLEEFVKAMGIPREKDLIVPKRKKQWEDNLEKIKNGEFTDFKKLNSLIDRYRLLPKEEYYSTVGAVAIDDNDQIVAATSTGGISMKIFGRIGDTPLIGCGTYADKFGAASATGQGEKIMKLTLCRLAVAYMETMTAQEAIEKALARAREIDCDCGLIGIDFRGTIGKGNTSNNMS